MQFVYSDDNRFIVHNLYNLLSAEGFPVVLKNEFTGSVAGDVPPQDAQVEIWLKDDEQMTEVQSFINHWQAEEGDDWICSACKESNGSAFELCWSCGEPQVGHSE